MRSNFDRSKFVFSETFNNSNGKSSGSGFAGIVLTLVGAVCFLAAMVGYFIQLPNTLEVMGKIIIVLTLSAALLGVRKFMGSKNNVSIGGNGDNNDKPDFDDSDSGQIVDAAKPIKPAIPIVPGKI
jgi:hypothetical protein